MTNDLILHAGMMKSGTTYIQNILTKNRAVLQQSGWLYPGDEYFNQQLACYGICGHDIPWYHKTLDEYIREHKKMGKELVQDVLNARKTGSVLVSAEALSALSNSGIDHFLKIIGSPNKVIFTVRPLFKTLASAWQQQLRGGGLEDIHTYMARVRRDWKSSGELWRIYAYGNAIERWATSVDCPIDVIILPSIVHPSKLWKLFEKSGQLPELADIEVLSSQQNRSFGLLNCMAMLRMNMMLDEMDISRAEVERIRRYFFRKITPAIDHDQAWRVKIPEMFIQEIGEWEASEMEKLNEFSHSVHGDISSMSPQPIDSFEPERYPLMADVQSIDLLARQFLLLLDVHPDLLPDS